MPNEILANFAANLYFPCHISWLENHPQPGGNTLKNPRQPTPPTPVSVLLCIMIF